MLLSRNVDAFEYCCDLSKSISSLETQLNSGNLIEQITIQKYSIQYTVYSIQYIVYSI